MMNGIITHNWEKKKIKLQSIQLDEYHIAIVYPMNICRKKMPKKCQKNVLKCWFARTTSFWLFMVFIGAMGIC
jgi:hypothetical protein